MWSKLKKIFEKDNSQLKYNLLQEFFGYTYDKNLDVATHVSRLENLAYRLNTLNERITDSMLILKILSTLPEKYKNFATGWESTGEADKTLENFLSRLQIEESRYSTEKETPVAFGVFEKENTKEGHNTKSNKQKASTSDKRCYNCNKTCHFKTNCPNIKSNRNNVKCKICKKTNHAEKDCFFRNKNKNTTDKLAFLANSNVDENE